MRALTAMSLRFLPFLLALCLSTGTHAALPAGITQGATVEGITEYALANGLRVLLFPDPSQAKTVVNITYLVGSRHESYGETGMAHLLEHMTFKGTATSGNFWDEMRKRGMNNNGTTWVDRTNYFETFSPSDTDLEWALSMEADRMINSRIARADLDTEMTVVRNEMERAENNPWRALQSRMLSSMFRWHSYGKETLGARSDVEGVDIGRLQSFYRTYYQPDNAVLLVAGAFDTDKTLGWIARYFGPIPRPARVLPRLYTQEPVQDGERLATVRRVGDSQLLAVAYRAVPGAHPDYVALDALADVMTVAPAGRLYQSLVETKKASSVESWAADFYDPGFVAFFAVVPQQDSIAAARETMIATLEGLASTPITAAEVERIRNKARKQYDEMLADPAQLGIALSNSIASGDWRLFFLNRDRYRTVTAADVQRVAATYLKQANRTVAQVIPEAAPDRAPPTAAVDVAALVRDYKGDPPPAQGEVFDATPANLEARTQRFVLSNGMKVALLPKKTRGETVKLAVQIHQGDEKSLFDRAPQGMLAAAMLTRGTATKNRQQIEDALDRLRAKVAVTGASDKSTLTGETVRTELPEMLKLVAELLRTPAFPPAEFAKLQREEIVALEGKRKDPEALAQRALARYGNPYPAGDVRHAWTYDEEIARIRKTKVEDVRDFHRQFAGGTYAEIAIVGDFDPAATRAAIGDLFGDWRSQAPFVRIPDPLVAKAAVSLRVETPDRANAALSGALPLAANDDDRDFPAMLAATAIVGDVGTARLWKRIREKEGLSYGVYAFLRADPIERNTPLQIYAIFAPQNRERLAIALNEELVRAARDGFTEAEVNEAKTSLLKRRQVARTQDAVIATALVQQEYLGRTFAYAGKLDAAIAALTAADVTSTFRKYVDPSAFAFVYAGDFARK